MPQHTTQHFEMHIGDSKLLTITVEDGAGTAINISTASEIRFRVAGNQFDTVIDISKNLTDDSAGDVIITNGAAGIFTVQLNPADTSDLSHGIYEWVSEIDDASNNISTVTTGYISLIPRVGK